MSNVLSAGVHIFVLLLLILFGLMIIYGLTLTGKYLLALFLIFITNKFFANKPEKIYQRFEKLFTWLYHTDPDYWKFSEYWLHRPYYMDKKAKELLKGE